MGASNSAPLGNLYPQAATAAQFWLENFQQPDPSMLNSLYMVAMANSGFFGSNPMMPVLGPPTLKPEAPAAACCCPPTNTNMFFGGGVFAGVPSFDCMPSYHHTPPDIFAALPPSGRKTTLSDLSRGYHRCASGQLSPLSTRLPPTVPLGSSVTRGGGAKAKCGGDMAMASKGGGGHHQMPPRFQCPDCSRSYSTFSGLSKHRQFHCASQLKRQFSCKFCQKNYNSLSALKMHIRTHTLPCKCTLCGKAFSRPWLLQGHLRTHTGEKPFGCGHCGRSFADRSNLRAHLQTHSEIKKYHCKTCQKTFSRMSLLSKHESNGCPGLIVAAATLSA